MLAMQSLFLRKLITSCLFRDNFHKLHYIKVLFYNSLKTLDVATKITNFMYVKLYIAFLFMIQKGNIIH